MCENNLLLYNNYNNNNNNNNYNNLVTFTRVGHMCTLTIPFDIKQTNKLQQIYII